MTSSTRCRVAPLVGRLPDSTCETVLMDTLAARATSRMVTALGRGSCSSRPTETGGSVLRQDEVTSSPCLVGSIEVAQALEQVGGFARRGPRRECGRRSAARRAPGPAGSGPRSRALQPARPAPPRPRSHLGGRQVVAGKSDLAQVFAHVGFGDRVLQGPSPGPPRTAPGQARAGPRGAAGRRDSRARWPRRHRGRARPAAPRLRPAGARRRSGCRARGSRVPAAAARDPDRAGRRRAPRIWTASRARCAASE